MAIKFVTTAGYVVPDDLALAVNAAVALGRALLVKAEQGTGKTELARQAAASLGMDLIEWHVRSTTKAKRGLYDYDAVARLRDGQLSKARVQHVANFIRPGKLCQAFTAKTRRFANS